jgi:hypothetical protein
MCLLRGESLTEKQGAREQGAMEQGAREQKNRELGSKGTRKAGCAQLRVVVDLAFRIQNRGAEAR